MSPASRNLQHRGHASCADGSVVTSMIPAVLVGLVYIIVLQKGIHICFVLEVPLLHLVVGRTVIRPVGLDHSPGYAFVTTAAREDRDHAAFARSVSTILPYIPSWTISMRAGSRCDIL